MLFLALLLLADWPQFRGPAGDGHALPDTHPVTKWDETTNILWKSHVRGVGWSSPVVADGRIWVTTSSPDGRERGLIALDLKNGQPERDIPLFTVSDPPDISRFNSYATPTPALADGKVIAHFGSAGTACIEAATGKVLWKRDDLPCDHWRGAASSPIIHKGKVFLQLDGYDLQYAVALDLNSGKTIWKENRQLPYPDNGDLKKAFATPTIITIDGHDQLISSAAVGTVALDPDSGRELWRVVHGGMNEACRPLSHKGLVYLTTGHIQQVWAVRPGQDSVAVEWKFTKEAPSRPSPIIVGEDLYVVNDKGTISCLEALTGKLQWQERLNETVSASPLFAGGHIYIVGERGKIFVVRPNRDTLDLVATNKLDDGCRASPAVAGDVLIVRTLTHIYAIGKK